MRSSPSSSSIALTNAWNDAFVGAIPILPFHFGSVSVEDGVRNLVLRERVGVVRDHARAARGADPVAVRIAEARGHAVERCLRQLREQPFALDGAERARVLREEDVGGRVVALLGDRRRELGAVAVAHLDVDARLLLEALEERLDELLLAARVDDERLVSRPRRRRPRNRPPRRAAPQPPAPSPSACVVSSRDCQVPLTSAGSLCKADLTRQAGTRSNTVTRRSCGCTETREPSGTTSVEGRCEITVAPSESRTR